MTSAALAILRIVVGLVFAVHGWGKFMAGFDAVSQTFQGMGLPLPMPSAVAVAIAELLCGLAVALGLYTRLAAIPLMVVMVVAMLVSHLPNGFFIYNNGYEYTLVLLTCLVAITLGGPGRPAVDQLFRRGKHNDQRETGPPTGSGAAGLA